MHSPTFLSTHMYKPQSSMLIHKSHYSHQQPRGRAKIKTQTTLQTLLTQGRFWDPIHENAKHSRIDITQCRSNCQPSKY